MMNPLRFATVAWALCQTAVLAGWFFAPLESPSSAAIENAAAAKIVERHEPSLTADAAPTNTPQTIAMASAAADSADVATAAAPVRATAAEPAATAAEPVTATATDATASSNEPKSFAVASLTDSSQILSPETPPVQAETAGTPDPVSSNTQESVSTLEIREECLVVDICIDRFLWALYERTRKEDTIKVYEQRKVTIKRKGKTRTVTRTFTKLVDNDFTWKDPKAAERMGMPMIDYVIGGMDRSFKLKLFHALHAAEQAGLSPGITSAFRDDYRQSIASGLKAAADRSYHGGSFRGGYGHGLAADIVSVKGGSRAQRWVSTEILWKWIDTNGKSFGVGRPYLDRDPPHVGPIDGKEYVSRRVAKVQHAASDVKKRSRVADIKKNKRVADIRKNKRVAMADDRNVAKRPKTARLTVTAATGRRVTLR
jgi:hypothetical protein